MRRSSVRLHHAMSTDTLAASLWQGVDLDAAVVRLLAHVAAWVCALERSPSWAAVADALGSRTKTRIATLQFVVPEPGWYLALSVERAEAARRQAFTVAQILARTPHAAVPPPVPPAARANKNAPSAKKYATAAHPIASSSVGASSRRPPAPPQRSR